MRLRVVDAIPLVMFAGVVLSAALSPESVATGPSGGAQGATVSAGHTLYPVREGGTAVVQVRVTTPSGGPLAAPVVVGYATGIGTATAGVDYRPVAGTLTFPAGTPSGATATFAVPTARDRTAEPGETVPVRLASGTNGVRVDWRQPTIVIDPSGPPRLARRVAARPAADRRPGY
jgi:beta-glucosidase